jgi:hypothetical protein
MAWRGTVVLSLRALGRADVLQIISRITTGLEYRVEVHLCRNTDTTSGQIMFGLIV